MTTNNEKIKHLKLTKFSNRNQSLSSRVSSVLKDEKISLVYLQIFFMGPRIEKNGC